ncbi:NUDIX domain-containing protein [Paenibacillus albiflavus]|uniref:NUDIX domain-containing protein n=1 Tax=Paenibacillus albiflavus TaxID=2545760 RepID=A0A4R4EBG5_9BACL|nr:NUDIX domain-containing protein [Paenibacillus albiflavus]TCZ77019.1 NUDIX domain-containing protein [Paenibacillus albiflavus]
MKEISAGGVVYNRVNGKLQIQMIRDRYQKMTLAKGKMEPGETIEQTALREIEEETGIVGRIIKHLEDVKYEYTHPSAGPVDKEVSYYLVEAVSGSLQPQVEEINQVEWLTPEEAWQQQLQSGYRNNDSVLRQGLLELGVEVTD